MFCDNYQNEMGAPIVPPACYQGQATKKLTIQYNEVEKDSLNLCAKCCQLIARDARRHGYRATSC